MSYRLGFDIGGTFTDLTLVNETNGEVYQDKVPTTEPQFSQGGIEGVKKICAEHDVPIEDVAYLSHGTTVATNALLEQTGTNPGLITTAGFEDVLAIGREKRDEIYDLSPSKAPTFADRGHRYGVSERVTADGVVRKTVDREEVLAIGTALEDAGIDSVAVSLLHAYRFTEHEEKIADILREETELSVSVSSQVLQEINEYERTLATVINAYVSPIVTAYIDRLSSGLEEINLTEPLNLMQANGGVLTPANIEGRQLRLINSGPAAGVLGAKQLASHASVEDLITLDMGGTSTDTCLVHDGKIATTTEGEIASLPLRFPQIDVRTIGTGGGSIAWIDQTGSLKVGPQSAGAQPGPACYGRGGTKPTVTDAALVLNYLNPTNFLGGEMELDEAAAEEVLTTLAADLDVDLIDLANGILEIVATDMVGGIRVVTVEKGYDPREFALTCYGGAGPMFADRLARKIGIETAIIPAACGVLSAFGLISADKRFDIATSQPVLLGPEHLDKLNEIYTDLERRAREVAPDASFSRTADIRYYGQTFKLDVDLPEGKLDQEALTEIRSRFETKYKAIYGETNPTEPLEAVTWRLDAVSGVESVHPHLQTGGTTVDEAITSTRKAYAEGEFRDYTVYDRYQLPSEQSIDGPAIVEEDESTTVIAPRSTFQVDAVGNLVIDVGND